MVGPLDEVGNVLAKGDTVVVYFGEQRLVGIVQEVKEPGLIAANAPMSGGKVSGMQLPGLLQIALMPLTIPWTKERPQTACNKIVVPHNDRKLEA